MSKKVKKASTKESCYPFFDDWLNRRLKELLKEERKKKHKSYPKDKKEMLALVRSLQPKSDVRLTDREIEIAKKGLGNKRKRKS